MPRATKFGARAAKPEPPRWENPTASGPAGRPAPGKRPPTILLVDDDPSVREGLRRLLVGEGWTVAVASSGEAALEQLHRREPGLMITDLCMAQVDGWDLLFHERLQRPDLPVFVITALATDCVAGADQIATEFFPKPMDLDALLAAIERWLGPAPRSRRSG